MKPMARFHRLCVRRGLLGGLVAAALSGASLLCTTSALAHNSATNPWLPTVGNGSSSAESIVRFQPGTSADEMQKAVTDAGGVVTAVIPEISAVAISADSSKVDSRLEANSDVTAVMPDRYLSWGSNDSYLGGGKRSHLPPFRPVGRPGSFPDPLHDAAAPNPEGIIQWDDNRADVPAAWRTTKGSKSIVVAVLDTGVSGNTTELRSNYDARTSENALDCRSIIQEYGIDFLKDNGILDECHNGDNDGHGTWVASRIGAAANGFGSNGVAPSVTIRSYKVLAGEWGGLTSWIVGGMVDACRDGADIVNMSIEGYDDPTYAPDADDYLLWADAVNYCHSRGTAIVAAAGNEHVQLDRTNITVDGRHFIGAGQVSYGPNGIGTVYPGDSLQPYLTELQGMLLVPGGVPGVIAVSATANSVVNAPDANPSVRWPAKLVGSRDQLAYYSNYGSRIDLAAPGGARDFNIPLYDGGEDDVLTGGYGTFSAVDANSSYCTDPELSASYNSDCFTIAGQGFAWSQGTSMSAPVVTGVAVLTLATHPALRGKPDALLAWLQQTARDNVVNYTGPNDPGNTAPDIWGDYSCSTGYCHLAFNNPIPSSEAYGAGIVDAGAAVRGVSFPTFPAPAHGRRPR
jgi:hypothetical protein